MHRQIYPNFCVIRAKKWYAVRDLNPHAGAKDPKSFVSANSTNRAKKQSDFKSFSETFEITSLIYTFGGVIARRFMLQSQDRAGFE